MAQHVMDCGGTDGKNVHKTHFNSHPSFSLISDATKHVAFSLLKTRTGSLLIQNQIKHFSNYLQWI